MTTELTDQAALVAKPAARAVDGIGAGCSSESCTAAFATTPPTAKPPPGHTAKSLKPLDDLRPWDVYTSCRFSNSMSNSQMKCPTHVQLDISVRKLE